jgi:hypothetical protein
MEFGNTIRTLISPERGDVTEISSARVGNSNERLIAGTNSRPAIQLKEIIALVGLAVQVDGSHHFYLF